ncbi:MAG: NYN domain-containing protein [Acetobacteraceae bacterium]|nr:NYN domain-containing protein [Acetobacteraceae bacterium]
MRRIAVFVDAGYLFAQGSTALCGSKQPRTSCLLVGDIVINKLKQAAIEQSEGAALLRIYWYDAMGPGGLTRQQEIVADWPNVKLRLGAMNSQGQQKGVDSLIVTDLIDLARNRAFADALIVTGDEDTRIGVQIAQSYGVRVHVLGITPARGSQSKQLRQEADTLIEWDRDTISTFLTVVPVLLPLKLPLMHELNVVAMPDGLLSAGNPTPEVEDCATGYIGTLGADQLQTLSGDLELDRNIPADHDRQLLQFAARKMGRWLDAPEKRNLRDTLRRLLKG